jgi:DNA-binding CsgD family transcriptional regulator
MPESTSNPHGFNEGALELSLMRAALNQVDYGLAVIAVDSQQVLFTNGPALAALQADSAANNGLCVQEGCLRPRRLADVEQLHLALQRTKVGQRGLLQFKGREGKEGSECSVAVMPLSAPGYALMAFSKQQICDTTTVTLFARERGLTGAEGQVLAQLCKGLRPQQIAVSHGVQVSTVRTQLRSIREKTACGSVRDLVEKISVLPPVSLHLALNIPDVMGEWDSTSRPKLRAAAYAGIRFQVI